MALVRMSKRDPDPAVEPVNIRYVWIRDSAFRHQLQVLQHFGFEVYDVFGTALDCTAIPLNPAPRVSPPPSIVTFINASEFVDVAFCYAARADGGAHTFVIDRGWFADKNTPNGDPMPIAQLPASLHQFLQQFRVHEVVLVRAAR